MARVGKIARLPHQIREELNKRLRDGEGGPALLPWLNSLPEVQAVIKDSWAGQPINASNLSDWRQGGFIDWEKRQSNTFRVKEFARVAVELSEANGGRIADGACAIASGKLLELLETVADAESGVDVAQIKDVIGSLVSLRSAEIAQQTANTQAARLKQKDREIALAQAAFDQKLKEYQDKVAAQKRQIEDALTGAKRGGITPETMRKIEEAARLL